MSALFSHLIVEPDDGVEPVRNLITSAEKSLLIKQFTFSEPTLLQAVTDRKNAGVEVRVMLNPKRSGGDRANDDTYDYFKKNGVRVQWANPKFYVTHEKSIVVDAETALIATFNLALKYFTQTRDYGVVTNDQAESHRSSRDSKQTGSIATGFPTLKPVCFGATRIPGCACRISSTVPNTSWTFSILNSSMRSSSIVFWLQPIGASTCVFFVGASTGSAIGMFSIRFPRYGCSSASG